MLSVINFELQLNFTILNFAYGVLPPIRIRVLDRDVRNKICSTLFTKKRHEEFHFENFYLATMKSLYRSWNTRICSLILSDCYLLQFITYRETGFLKKKGFLLLLVFSVKTCKILSHSYNKFYILRQKIEYHICIH